MIGSLRGRVAGRPSAGEVLLEVGGVGYRLSMTVPGAASLRGGDEAFVHVHTHVREDALVLYGFVHEDERRCFEALLGAHGVGPSLALAILSVLSPVALSTAVLEDDLATLCAVPGVGRKTAARLLIDLKSRLDLPDVSEAGDAGPPDGRSVRAEVRAALLELGYGADEIAVALKGAGDQDGVEVALRAALRELAAR